MANMPNQKLKLLRIMEYLKEYTDEDHGLRVAEIIRLLEQEGISAERKSMYTNMDTLQEFGIDAKYTGQEWRIMNRPLSEADVAVAYAALENAEFSSAEQATRVQAEILGLASRPQRESILAAAETAAGEIQQITIDYAPEAQTLISTRFPDHGSYCNQRDGRRQITVKVPVSPTLLQWFLLHADVVKVQRPAIVREQLAELLSPAKKAYGYEDEDARDIKMFASSYQMRLALVGNEDLKELAATRRFPSRLEAFREICRSFDAKMASLHCLDAFPELPKEQIIISKTTGRRVPLMVPMSTRHLRAYGNVFAKTIRETGEIQWTLEDGGSFSLESWHYIPSRRKLEMEKPPHSRQWERLDNGRDRWTVREDEIWFEAWSEEDPEGNETEHCILHCPELSAEDVDLTAWLDWVPRQYGHPHRYALKFYQMAWWLWD